VISNHRGRVQYVTSEKKTSRILYCNRQHKRNAAPEEKPHHMKRSLVNIHLERSEQIILLIRGEKVILDSHLATLYGISTSIFNEQVKRNRRRFPPDFSFRLTTDEWKSLISQFAISKLGRGGRHKLPYVFTEQAAVELSILFEISHSPICVNY
jgi:hypothetical protein